MRASLEIFHIFTFKNCYFLQYFVGTSSDTLSQKHIHFQVSNNICILNAFPFITYGMMLYINDSIPTKH